MKPTLFVLLIIGSYILNAQTLVTSDKLWSTMKGPVSGCNSFFCASYFTKFSGDTVIGGISYMKVQRSEDQQMLNWTNQGFIREESNHKVYFRDTPYKRECLLYDFGCKTGDTLHLDCLCTGTGYFVDSIKSIETEGVIRRYFYLTYLENKRKEIWIEGIGSKWGILNAGRGNCIIGGGENLLCFFEGGIKEYRDPGFPNYCYLSKEIINGIGPEKTVPQYKVYPNPASTELFVQSPQTNDGDFTLELYSVKGELVKTECLGTGSIINRIDVRSLKSGVYVVRLISAAGRYAEEMIIKK